MPRPIPSSLAESMPGTQASSFESGDVTRVHGGIGLPGEQDLDRMSANANTPEFEGSPWQTTLFEAHYAAKTITALAMPELAEFSQAGIDFAALQTGHEAYEAAGLKPELVLFPVNLPLANWRQIYTELRRRQDVEHPDSDYKLLEQTDGDGDGLYVWDAVAKVWPDLNQQAVASHAGKTVSGLGSVLWKAVVVPTVSREEGGLAVNTSFDLTKTSEAFQNQVRAVGTTAVTAANAHMPIGAYLTLQGAHILNDTPLLDSDTWTWNAGTFKDSQKNLQAPASYWGSGDGQVLVNCVSVGLSADYLGARLPVWG